MTEDYMSEPKIIEDQLKNASLVSDSLAFFNGSFPV